MCKEMCKTTKFIDFRFDNSVTFWHSHSISESHGKYKCVLSHPVPWDVSHGIPIGMTFPWSSLIIWHFLCQLLLQRDQTFLFIPLFEKCHNFHAHVDLKVTISDRSRQKRWEIQVWYLNQKVNSHIYSYAQHVAFCPVLRIPKFTRKLFNPALSFFKGSDLAGASKRLCIDAQFYERFHLCKVKTFFLKQFAQFCPATGQVAMLT